MPLLLLVGGFLASDLLRRVLLSAGLGLATAAFFTTILNIYIDRVINNLGGMPASVLGLLGLFGFDKALSIIIGALVMRASINAMSISVRKAT